MAITLPTTIDTSDKTPRTAIAFNRTSGVRQTADTTKEMLIVGQMLASGTATANVTYQLTRPTDSEGLFGEGSSVDVAAKAAFLANPNVILFAIGVADAGTKASATITITSNATASGEVDFFIMGRQAALFVTTGDTPTAQATNLANAINALPGPFVATSSAGVVTITCAIGGIIGNSIALRYSVPQGYVPGSTYALSGASLAGGTGTVSLTSPLAAAAHKRFHLVVACLDDQTTAQTLRDYATAQDTAQMGEIMVTALVGALSAQTTQALAVNGLRVVQCGINGTESWSVEVAAAAAAVMASENVATRPYNTLVLPGIKAPSTEKRWLQDQETKPLLDNGVTPLVVNSSEQVCFLRVVSTNVTNTAGYKDYSVLDITKPQAFDDLRDNIALMMSTNYPRARWAPDNDDGKQPADVAYPDKVESDLLDVLYDAESRGIVSDVDSLKSQIVVQKVGTQCQFSVPAEIVDGMHEKLGQVVMITTPFGS